jgi:hypothetical protein
MWKKVWRGTVGGYMWDDDEWMRRIERAEDGDATASAVLALYDTLMSHDDVPSRGRGRLIGHQYRLARLASLPSAPARMLTDMAAVLVDGAGSDGFDDLAFPVVYALGDNPALPRDEYDSLERAYGGDGGVCPELGVRNLVYANRVARRTILGNPAGCVAYVPERTLQAVREGIVDDKDVLAYLGEGRREWTLRDYSGKWVWTEDDALNVEMRLCGLNVW